MEENCSARICSCCSGCCEEGRAEADAFGRCHARGGCQSVCTGRKQIHWHQFDTLLMHSLPDSLVPCQSRAFGTLLRNERTLKALRLMKATYKKCRCVRYPILIILSVNVILCFKRRRYLHLSDGEPV